MNVVYSKIEDFITHNCQPCLESEHGRIRSLAFISTDYVFSDIESGIDWEIGINAAHIYIIPEVTGTCEKEVIYSKRVGDLPRKVLYRNYTISAESINFLENCGFYNSLSLGLNYRVAYITESIIQLSDKAVTIMAGDPIGDLLDARTWKLTITWWQKLVPEFNRVPQNIFYCNNTHTSHRLLLEDGSGLLLEDDTEILID